MSLGLRSRLLMGSLMAVLAIVLVSGLWLERRLKVQIEKTIQIELQEHARAVRELVHVLPGFEKVSEADPVADRMGKALSVRVTLIGHDGLVLGDSKVGQNKIDQLENHALRPECVGALSAEFGIATRYSKTLGADMLYVATRYQRDAVQGWVRVAVPMAELNDLNAQVEKILLVAAVLALLVALFISAIASQLISRRLRRLVNTVTTLSSRAIESRTNLVRGDELGVLVQSIDRMSDDLEHVVKTLAQERDQFGAVLQGMQEAVIAFDRQAEITIINESAKTLFGLNGELIGVAITQVNRLSSLHSMIQPKLGQAISSEFDLDCLPARTVLSRMTPLAASGGAVIVAHDVTDIRRLERVRRDFVANVSHELRTPVSVIRANAETLLDGALDDRTLSEQFVSAVLRNSERLSNLIGDLLDLSQIEAGHYEMNLAGISVSGAIRRTIDSVGHAANKKNMTISQAMTPDVQVLADMQALDQVLLNLVENAVKYTPVGGSVVIRSVAFEGAIRIEIEDDGVGVAPEHRDRLFERFYRVDPGRSKQMGGTGLGLAIVKHLVGAMGGLVGMRPSPEKGSIFWVELPPLK